MHIESEEECEETIQAPSINKENRQDQQTKDEGQDVEQASECLNHYSSTFRRGKPRTF